MKQFLAAFSILLLFISCGEEVTDAPMAPPPGVGVGPSNSYFPTWDFATDTLYLPGDMSLTGSISGDVVFDTDDTVDHMLKDITNSGVLHEIVITDAGGLGISWAAGKVWDSTADASVDIDAGSGTCTTDVVNYLYWDRSGGGTALTLSTTKWNILDNDVAVGIIITQNDDIYALRQIDTLDQRESDINSAMREIFKVVVTEGLLVTEDVDATNAFDVQISSGAYYHFGIERNELSAGFNSRTTAITRWFHDASNEWTFDSNAQIDAANWDNMTDSAVPTANTANKYYKSMFMYSDNMIHWIYPQVEYNTIAEALAAPLPAIPTVGNHFPKSAAVVLKGNAAAFPTAGGEQWEDLRPFVSSQTAGIVTTHANLGGLDYASAGHTGFYPGTYGTLLEVPNGSPASDAACTQWEIQADASYVYICTATGVWKRAALTGGY